MVKVLKATVLLAALFSPYLMPFPAEARSLRTTATYYSNYFVGRRMANGKKFYQNRMVAAHPTIKLGTRIKVVHGRRSVIVTVSDRCRCTLDLSRSAFSRLASTRKGRIPVRVYY